MAQTGCTSTQYVIPVSGTTGFTPTYATYINGMGESVVQCGAVLLGGAGLNS
jgi:hypothetical protein